MAFKVTEEAMRPASDLRQCFYCKQPIGADHKDDCVLVRVKVKVRMTVEYVIESPAHWGEDDIEFQRNEGSWCANNAIEELEELSKNEGCLCYHANFEYLSTESEPFLSED